MSNDIEVWENEITRNEVILSFNHTKWATTYKHITLSLTLEQNIQTAYRVSKIFVHVIVVGDGWLCHLHNSWLWVFFTPCWCVWMNWVHLITKAHNSQESLNDCDSSIFYLRVYQLYHYFIVFVSLSIQWQHFIAAQMKGMPKKTLHTRIDPNEWIKASCLE